MKAPDKIYLQIENQEWTYKGYADAVTWCQDRINDTDVKYIRAASVDVLKED